MANPVAPKGEVESRLSRLEATVEGVASELAHISQTIKGLGTVNWSTYIGFAGIILTIVGLVGGAVFAGYAANQGRMEAIISKMIDRAMEREYDRGVVFTQIGALESITKKLDVDLQREMRDVNATTEAKLVALDRRIQDEITRTAMQLTEARKSLEVTVDKLRDFQDEASGTHAAQDEKLRTLERQVFFNK